MKRGEVYLIRLDPVEGSEQSGVRPAVLVSRDAINLYSPVVVICPITDASHVKRKYPGDVLLKAPEGGLKKDSIVLTGQIRAVAKHRLAKLLGRLSSLSILELERAIKITLDLT